MNRNQRSRQDITTRFKQDKSVAYETSEPGDQYSFRRAAVAYARHRGFSAAWIDPRLLKRIGDVPISRVDQHLLDAAATELKPNGRPATRDRTIYTPVSAVLKYAARRGWCRHWRISRPRSAKVETELPAIEHLDRLIDKSAVHLKDIIIFIVRTGAGERETITVDWSDVDLERRRMRIRSKRRVRTIPIDSVIFDRLLSLSHHTGTVFRDHLGYPYNVKKCGGGYFKTALNKAAKRAGLSRIKVCTLKKIWSWRCKRKWIDVETKAELKRYRAPRSFSRELSVAFDV